MNEGLGIAVMMNNYTHDLATAVFAVTVLTAWLILRTSAIRRAPEALGPVIHGLQKAGVASLAATLILGAVRAATYKQFEWSEAVGRAQVPALVVKHIILVSLVMLGLRFLFLVRKQARAILPEERSR